MLSGLKKKLFSLESQDLSLKELLFQFSSYTKWAGFAVGFIIVCSTAALIFAQSKADRAPDVALALERASADMDEINAEMLAYMADPVNNAAGILDRGSSESSADHRLSQALALTHEPDMVKSITEVQAFIKNTLTPITNEFEAKMKEGSEKAKKHYNEKYAPAHIEFMTLINLSRNQSVEMKEHAQKLFKWIVYGAPALMLLLVSIAMGFLSIRSKMLSVSVTQSLLEIGNRLKEAAHSVRNSSQSLSGSSQSLASSVTEQASAQEQTITCVHEVNSIIRKTKENSDLSLKIADNGQSEIRSGKEVTRALKAATDDVNAHTSKLENIVKAITEIETKTKIINSIVFETKLLSFNASVEAARAGEHGKGFSIVAEEIGKLAKVSGSAAQEIDTLIQKSRNEVMDVVKVTQEKLKHSNQISEKVADAFESISHVMEQIAQSAQSTAAAAGEQTVGMEQINRAAGSMGEATELNKQSAQKLADYAQTLAAEAGVLLNSVATLRKLSFGEDAENEIVSDQSFYREQKAA